MQIGEINPGSKSDDAQARQIQLKHSARQLEILARRGLDLADRVAVGEIAFIDAVDVLYDAAVWSGLTESVGDDVVQACLAAAFANARRPA